MNESSITTNNHNGRPVVRLRLGQLVATPGAVEAMARAGQDPAPLLARHRCGDWGEVDAADAAANDRAVREGERVLSAYTLRDGTRLWVITEADRSSTCILLPDEY
jgi:hypothetical protein